MTTKKPDEKTKETAPAVQHELVPKHELISEENVNALLSEYGIQKNNLPKILKNDPALAGMEAKRGDVVKINRRSPTAITSYYYRVVI